jgi:prepilin peptidase CpaA
MVTAPLVIASFLPVALSLCMLWVVVSDAARYIIPNTLNMLLLALYVLAALFLPELAPLPALGAAAIILVVGLGLFSLGLMGGGDIKLLVVLSLWTGWSIATAQFIFLTAIFGGLLVLIILPARFILAPLWLKARPGKLLPRLLTKKQPVPYGIAIAAAFLWLLWNGSIAGLS